MTKMEARFRLTEPLDDRLAEQVANLHGVYGIYHVKPTATLDGLVVEYDGSRLSEFEVNGVLARAGLPVEKQNA